MMCSHPFFSSREQGRVHFPAFLVDVISPMRWWAEECVTSGPRQLSISVNVPPATPTPNLSPIRTVGIKELWDDGDAGRKQLGSESLLKENSTPHGLPHTGMWGRHTFLCFKPLRFEGLFGTTYSGLKMARNSLTLLSLKAGVSVLESGLDWDCFGQ